MIFLNDDRGGAGEGVWGEVLELVMGGVLSCDDVWIMLVVLDLGGITEPERRWVLNWVGVLIWSRVYWIVMRWYLNGWGT